LPLPNEGGCDDRQAHQHRATYANGRPAAEDPLTGWDVELGIFGADNRAAFE